MSERRKPGEFPRQRFGSRVENTGLGHGFTTSDMGEGLMARVYRGVVSYERGTSVHPRWLGCMPGGRRPLGSLDFRVTLASPRQP